jgi:hypothetical protein
MLRRRQLHGWLLQLLQPLPLQPLAMPTVMISAAAAAAATIHCCRCCNHKLLLLLLQPHPAARSLPRKVAEGCACQQYHAPQAAPYTAAAAAAAKSSTCRSLPP